MIDQLVSALMGPLPDEAPTEFSPKNFARQLVPLAGRIQVLADMILRPERRTAKDRNEWETENFRYIDEFFDGEPSHSDCKKAFVYYLRRSLELVEGKCER